MRIPTREEIANNYNLWIEYVCRDYPDTKEQFERRSFEERLAIQKQIWPQDYDETEV